MEEWAGRGPLSVYSVGGVAVGRLYDAVGVIDRVIGDRGLDPVQTKGLLSMKAGFFLAIVFENTPDDPDKLAKLQAAAKEVLGVDINV